MWMELEGIKLSGVKKREGCRMDLPCQEDVGGLVKWGILLKSEARTLYV